MNIPLPGVGLVAVAITAYIFYKVNQRRKAIGNDRRQYRSDIRQRRQELLDRLSENKQRYNENEPPVDQS